MPACFTQTLQSAVSDLPFTPSAVKRAERWLSPMPYLCAQYSREGKRWNPHVFCFSRYSACQAVDRLNVEMLKSGSGQKNIKKKAKGCFLSQCSSDKWKRCVTVHEPKGGECNLTVELKAWLTHQTIHASYQLLVDELIMGAQTALCLQRMHFTYLSLAWSSGLYTPGYVNAFYRLYFKQRTCAHNNRRYCSVAVTSFLAVISGCHFRPLSFWSLLL